MVEHNHKDDYIDDDLYSYLRNEHGFSFFLFAGAGSGKTRSLVKLLNKLKTSKSEIFKEKNQKIAIITYTNAASNEIENRLGYDSLFNISTIHSFAWGQIKYFTNDIKDYLVNSYASKVEELEKAESKGRKGTNASLKRLADIERYNEKLKDISKITKFIYDPLGVNIERNAIGHSDVLKILSFFLKNKRLFQKIFLKKYPILLIDESQDTNSDLIQSFIKLEQEFPDRISIGLFGDMMQRIFPGGMNDLDKNIPDTWQQPKKLLNHRSPNRIVKLNNSIRKNIDGLSQSPRSDAKEGLVHFFVYSQSYDKKIAESEVRQKMSEFTQDANWKDEKEVKSLILEHHMSASRLGFDNFFFPLYEQPEYRSGMIDKENYLNEITFLSDSVVPLIDAIKNSNHFKIMEILKQKNSILYPEVVQQHPEKNTSSFKELMIVAKDGINEITEVTKKNNFSTLEVIQKINEYRLFKLPTILEAISIKTFEEYPENDIKKGDNLSKINAWYRALDTDFNELAAYLKYNKGESEIGTHQGVKGLEFPRVLVIMDDLEARGFTFKFEELFDENISGNRIDSTRRLFYVVCSRAEESLALILYSEKPEDIKRKIINSKWFDEDEVCWK